MFAETKKKETKPMKSTKILLTAIGAAAVMNLAAFAGDLKVELVSNGHGQVIPVYRSDESTIALFTGERGTGKTVVASSPALVSKDNGHGQSIPMYR